MPQNEQELHEFGRAIARNLHRFFGDRMGELSIDECVPSPHRLIRINFTLYNYFAIQCGVGIGIGFSVISKPRALDMVRERHFDSIRDLSRLGILLPKLDREVRLRIPDKYLEAKGWGDPV